MKYFVMLVFPFGDAAAAILGSPVYWVLSALGGFNPHNAGDLKLMHHYWVILDMGLSTAALCLALLLISGVIRQVARSLKATATLRAGD